MGTEGELSTKISTEFSGDTISTSGNSVRQRKKRKWDQPAESLISTGYTASLMQQPYVGVGPLSGITSPLVGVVPSVSMPSNLISTPQFPSAAIPQSTVAIVQKINQDLALKGLIPPSKVQDEIIAREIIINDAEPNVRYKLTKRQTQEEIQGKTGAVVITRGKYRLPNGPIESEKPLYLHISAGAHLKDRTERIKAVDQAASIVEEIMRQGRLSQSSSIPYPLSGQGSAPFSIALYVGLESDGAFNLLGRIRGPNDQYINHIMHETGATVILRGRGSGHSEGANGEELQHPLHLFISSDNARSLESAKALAEHLLETVRADCLASRASTYKVPVTVTNSNSTMTATTYQASYSASTPYAGLYPQATTPYSQSFAITSSVNSLITQPTTLMSSSGYKAVPPPQNLLSATEVVKTEVDKSSAISLETKPIGSIISSTAPSAIATFSDNSVSACTASQISQGPFAVTASTSTNPLQVPSTFPSIGVTNYSGYGGIYPQATPLQQVAHALQRPPPPVSVKPTISNGKPTNAQLSFSNGHNEKQPEKRRKFQETPAMARERPKVYQTTMQETDNFKVDDSSGVPATMQRQPFTTLREMPSRDISSSDVSLMPPPPPKVISSRSMPPTDDRSMSSLPPPKNSSSRKFTPVSEMLTIPLPLDSTVTSTASLSTNGTQIFSESSSKKLSGVSDTSLKLVDYGEEDDEDSNVPVIPKHDETLYPNGKPFWAP